MIRNREISPVEVMGATLARLGYQVDAIDASAVACEKAERFARAVEDHARNDEQVGLLHGHELGDRRRLGDAETTRQQLVEARDVDRLRVFASSVEPGDLGRAVPARRCGSCCRP